MTYELSRALVRTILEHAEDHPWRMQDVGLMGLRLDQQREHRLHVWDPTQGVGEPPVHDHPYHFTSTVIVGELTNVRYEEDPAGEEHERLRYVPRAEDERRADTVRLTSTATTFHAGAQYRQLAPELHTSLQQPGTVSAIRCEWVDVPELTVCTRPPAPWRSATARPATRDEIRSFAAKALAWF